MKNKISGIIIAMLMMLPISLSAADEDTFYYNGLYYRIIDSVSRTVEVSSDNNGSSQNPAKGDIVIPGMFTYNDIEYAVTKIANEAFKGCTGLNSLDIPESVSYLGSRSFEGCKLTPLIIRNASPSFPYNTFVGLSDKSEIAAPRNLCGEIDGLFNGTLFPFEYPHIIKDLSIYVCSASFKLVENPYGLYSPKDCTPLVEIISSNLDSRAIKPDENGTYSVDRLESGGWYDLCIRWYNDQSEQIAQYEKEFGTKTMVSCYYEEKTASEISIKVSCLKDESISITEYGVKHYGNTYPCSGEDLLFENLKPKTEYTFTPYAIYRNKQDSTNTLKSYQGNPINVRTDDLYIYLGYNYSNIGPTNISIYASCNYDGEITEEYLETERYIENFEDYPYVVKGDYKYWNFTGLHPDSKYTFKYHVKTASGYSKSDELTVETLPLTLTTLKPRCVSESCAIVAAETNIIDEEKNVGFEWKKYDAPESLAPNEGYAAIYDGRLEGYIMNLQPAFYYIVRAFYKTNSGEKYYGDWVTFDPSDFSYFEPTVHTYPANEITGTSASVKGYALSGTDLIQEQGFEYWTESGNRMRIIANATTPDGVNTVFATGQVMRASLTGLQSATNYKFRAFVTTVSGTTYGEEQTFTTTGDSGTEYITVDTIEPEIIGYYDLAGRCYNKPQKGLNIVLYSNGTTRKIIMK